MGDIRESVREQYGKVGAGEAEGCCAPSCCAPVAPDEASRTLGYSQEEIAAVPEGANLGLGCGNPGAIAALKPGETVLDLGSGGGFDALLAARQVGPEGAVIGVDMTPEMITRARRNAEKVEAHHVSFRLGEIEHLPVVSESVDVVMSNCVVNLSPDKPQVFREVFRVLKPGGRVAISDIVALRPLTPQMQSDVALYVGCVAGTETTDAIESMLREAGFEQIEIDIKAASREVIASWFPDKGVEDWVASATIEAVRPEGEGR